MNPTYTSSQSEPYLNPSITPISTQVDTNVDDHDIDQTLSLTNKLFLEESFDKEILPTILEEEATYSKSQINNVFNIVKLISNRFDYI